MRKILAAILVGVGLTACQPSLVAEGKNTNPQPAPVAQKQEPAVIIPAPQADTQTPVPTQIVTGEVKQVPSKQEQNLFIDERVYIVQRGDNITNLAKQNLPSGVTLNQMIAAIYYGNERAFIHNNVNYVRAGSRIEIPSAVKATAIEPRDANALILLHESEWRERSKGSPQVPSS